MKVKIHLNKLLLKTKFTISHGEYNFRQSIVIECIQDSEHGFGETVVIDYYGLELESMLASIQSQVVHIEAWDIQKTEENFFVFLQKLFPNEPFIQCAFDCAYWDLRARLAQKSLRDYLQVPNLTEPPSSMTIGTTEDENVIQQKLASAWPVIKLKVNQLSRPSLYQQIRATEKSFGIDANGSLSIEVAQDIYEELISNTGIYLEQPFMKGNDQQVLELKRKQNLPILADESVQDLASLERLSEFYDGFVLKLTKCGGITPVLKMIAFCQKHHKKILAGCMTESSVGIANMYALLPYFDYADLDGATLISNDPYDGPTLQENGFFANIAKKGNGIEPKIS